MHKLTILVGLPSFKKEFIEQNVDKRDILVFDPMTCDDKGKGYEFILKSVNAQIGKRDIFLDMPVNDLKRRLQILREIKIPCKKVCIVLNKKVDFKDLSKEDRAELEAFEAPFVGEGWDEINLLNTIKRDLGTAYKIFKKMNEFNQNNKHHSQNLGEHSERVYRYIKENSNDQDLINGCYLHDIGKLWTQSYKEGDDNAHYFCHHNVGAYWKLCNGWTLEETFYENHHMINQREMSSKKINKYKKLFGEERWNNLVYLNKADSGGK